MLVKERICLIPLSLRGGFGCALGCLEIILLFALLFIPEGYGLVEPSIVVKYVLNLK